MMVVGHARMIGQGESFNSSNQSQELIMVPTLMIVLQSALSSLISFPQNIRLSLSLNLQFHSSIIRYRGRRHTYSCSRIGSSLPCGPRCPLCQHPSDIAIARPSPRLFITPAIFCYLVRRSQCHVIKTWEKDW